MSWSNWRKSDLYGGCQLNTNDDGEYIHHLVAFSDEEDPDSNHVHLKTRRDDGGETPILASVKEDGNRSVSRRKLIEHINNATGLDLSY